MKKMILPLLLSMMFLTSCDSDFFVKTIQKENAFYVGTYPTASVSSDILLDGESDIWDVYLYLDFIDGTETGSTNNYDIEFKVSNGQTLDGATANSDGVYPRYLDLTQMMLNGLEIDDFFNNGGRIGIFQTIGRLNDDNSIGSNVTNLFKGGCYSFSVISEENETLSYKRTEVYETVFSIGVFTND